MQSILLHIDPCVPLRRETRRNILLLLSGKMSFQVMSKRSRDAPVTHHSSSSPILFSPPVMQKASAEPDELTAYWLLDLRG